jgi:hypothetical protein
MTTHAKVPIEELDIRGSRLGELKQVVDALNIPTKFWVAGGAVRRAITGQDPFESDIDVFLQQPADAELVVSHFTEKGFKVARTTSAATTLRGTFVEGMFDVVEETQADLLAVSALTHSILRAEPMEPPAKEKQAEPIQLEIQIIGLGDGYASAAELLDSFDFTICQFAIDGDKVVFPPLALHDLNRKRLVINEVTYGLATMRRFIKYTKQGYFACGGVMTDYLTRIVEHPESIQGLMPYID